MRPTRKYLHARGALKRTYILLNFCCIPCCELISDGCVGTIPSLPNQHSNYNYAAGQD